MAACGVVVGEDISQIWTPWSGRLWCVCVCVCVCVRSCVRACWFVVWCMCVFNASFTSMTHSRVCVFIFYVVRRVYPVNGIGFMHCQICVLSPIDIVWAVTKNMKHWICQQRHPVQEELAWVRTPLDLWAYTVCVCVHVCVCVMWAVMNVTVWQAMDLCIALNRLGPLASTNNALLWVDGDIHLIWAHINLIVKMVIIFQI